MGYEIHIHRRAHWADEGSDISMEEWLEVCRQDTSLRADGTFGSVIDGVEVVGPVMSWLGDDGASAAFYHADGAINSKLRSRSAAAKAFEIAHALNARAQGDEGEFYDADGLSDAERSKPRSFLSRLFGR